MYSAEIYSDNGQAYHPPMSLVKVRIKPPLAITQVLIDHNIVGDIEVEDVASTVNASVYDLLVKGEPEQNTEDDHQRRVEQATHFISGILNEVNIIDDLGSDEWAHGMSKVGDI